jgi:hypothetical protein
MKTTVKQIEIPVAGGKEIIYFDDFATKASLDGAAKEASLLEVKKAVEDIDLSSIKGDNPDATNSAIYEMLSSPAKYNKETGILYLTNVNIKIE